MRLYVTMSAVMTPVKMSSFTTLGIAMLLSTVQSNINNSDDDIFYAQLQEKSSVVKSRTDYSTTDLISNLEETSSQVSSEETDSDIVSETIAFEDTDTSYKIPDEFAVTTFPPYNVSVTIPDAVAVKFVGDDSKTTTSFTYQVSEIATKSDMQEYTVRLRHLEPGTGVVSEKEDSDLKTESPTGVSQCEGGAKCVLCKAKTAPNPTDPLCTCCNHLKECLYQSLCVPMQLFCSRGHFLNYSPEKNAYICFPCPLGQYCNHRYCRRKCMICSSGFEAIVPEATECTPCNKGFYKAEVSSQSCEECPFGYSANQTGSIVCEAEDGIGIKRPQECNQERCAPCENLPTKAKLSDELCTCCPPGYCSYREACKQVQIPCEDGVLERDGFCYFCPEGTYCEGTTCTECTPCPAGTEKMALTKGICQKCKPGYYKEETGPSLCLPCPLGSYSLVEGSLECTVCPQRYFCPFSNHPPIICTDDYYCPVGSHGATSYPSEDIIQPQIEMFPPTSASSNWWKNENFVIQSFIILSIDKYNFDWL